MKRLLIVALSLLLPTTALAQFKMPDQKSGTNRTNATYITITNPASPFNATCQANKTRTIYSLSVASSMTVNFPTGGCQPNQTVEIEYKQTAGGVAITYVGTSIYWAKACTPTSCVQPTLSGNTKIDLFQFQYDALTAQMIEIGQALNVPPAAFAAGANGAIQYANGGNLAGSVVTGVVVGNGSSTPTALAGNTLAAHNFANSISASGVISGARPASTDLSDPVTPAYVGNTTALPGAYLGHNFGVVASAPILAGTGLTAKGRKVSITNTAVTAGSYTNANVTVNAQGQLTAASNGNGAVGFVNSPTVTPSGGNATATLAVQCVNADCTDEERIANAANAGTLTLTTPASGAMADGQYLYVIVNDTGTAPSSIIYTAGAGVTLKSLVLGDTSNALSSTFCGTPPSTGTVFYKFKWHLALAQLFLEGCGPNNPTANLAVALGGSGLSTLTAHSVQVGEGTSTPAQVGPSSTVGTLLTSGGSSADPSFLSLPRTVGIDFQGSVTASTIGAYTCAQAINFPTNLASASYPDGNSVVSCNANPSGSADDFIIAVNGTQKGDVSISTSCVGTFTAAAPFTCAAGQRLTITAPGTTHSETDVAITLWGHSP